MTKEEIFNNLIFKAFKNNEKYDVIKHGVNRAREMMMQHQTFEKAPAPAQYKMCLTIYIIAIQSQTKAIHSFRIISKPEERSFEYAIDEHFEPPTVIEEKQQKRLP